MFCADRTWALILSPPWHSLTSGQTVAGCIRHMCLANNKFITAAKTALGCSRHTFLMWNKLVCFFETNKKKILKSTRAVPVNTTRTLKDEEAEKKHKLTKDWPVICYPIFFLSCFLFAAWPFSLLRTNSKFAGISPRGNWIFWGEFEMFLNFSQRRLNFSLEEIVFPPEGNCISPQPIRGNSIFSRGESRKK